MIELDVFGAVEIKQNLFVHAVIVAGLVPVRINHHDVAARLEHNFLIEQRKREVAAVTSIDELSILRHEKQIKLCGLKQLLGIFLTIVLKTLTLL